jgi:cytochrome c oxidase subunit 1
MAIGRQPRPAGAAGLLQRPTLGTGGIVGWITTGDHKKIGIMYFITSFLFFGMGGIESMMIRTQLITPDNTVLNPTLYNEVFTIHGVTMIFLAVMPLGIAFGNYLMPLMIGARDLAFPRLNNFGYWIYLMGGLLFYSSILLGGAPDAGWFAYAPLTEKAFNPGHGMDFYALGLLISGIGTTVTGMNFIATIFNMRAPGMTLMRMPLFVWAILVFAVMIIFAFPPLNVGLIALFFDRNFGSFFFNPAGGGLPILWQHLFWIFGHPEVYILIMPAFGIISEVIPAFSRKPLFGYPVMVASIAAIAFLSFTVWAHHMLTTGMGATANTLFSLTSYLIAIPTGVKIWNWLATMWGGKLRFTTSMLFGIAFIFVFVTGGVTGVMVASPALDSELSASFFLIAHFHFILGGGALTAFFAGFYYWFPKITGKFMSERLGKWIFWLFIIGFFGVFMPQHFLGLLGMPRRIQTYPPDLGWNTLNLISSLSAYLLFISVVLFIYSLIQALRSPKTASADPWDARTLEWSIPSPPPVYDYAHLPHVHTVDAFWTEKYGPHPRHGRGHEMEDVRARHDNPREPNVPPRSPEPIHIPSPSWYPFIASLGITVLGYGFIYNHILAVLGLAIAAIAFFAWALEGTGNTHVLPEEDTPALTEEPV